MHIKQKEKMVDIEGSSELLFFDTFSHETDTDINLDLVQFPKPVYITQVRIIPLGARVQADFPGGVRLGATNPSKFDIEFFVNDLGMPGASTFENLGNLQYNQNDCIHLECDQEKIPTDGLVLRGWYSTITLAVYGMLTNILTENIASPPPIPPEHDILDEAISVNNSKNIIDSDILKEDWKELISPSDVKQMRKTPTHVSEFDHSDSVEYVVSRERIVNEVRHHHHHHNSSDERDRDRERDRERERDRDRDRDRDREREREHRMRKSLEHSPSARHRTHSESSERDYIRSRERDHDIVERDKLPDWSHSPEYIRHPRRKKSDRSRSDIEEPNVTMITTHKWPPRTPPLITNLESPPLLPQLSLSQRIHSPNYSGGEDTAAQTTSSDGGGGASSSNCHKHLKSCSYGKSIDSISEPQDHESCDTIQQVIDCDDPNNSNSNNNRSSTPIEQYEPILSDDEMIGDNLNDDDTITILEDSCNNAELEAELQAAAVKAKPAIIQFDPYKECLQKFCVNPQEYYGKDVENLEILLEKLNAETKHYNLEEFMAHSTDNQNNVIPDTTKSTTLNSVCNSGNGNGSKSAGKENFIFLCEQFIQQLTFVNQNLKRRNFVIKELCTRRCKNLEILYHILYIALNFEAACSHNQPVFITRHIKTGAKLMELLGSSQELFDYLWIKMKYDPFKSITSLLKQDYMAVPIKLLLLKAIYSLLDCSSALKHFLGPQWRGYRLILDLLQNTRLTRTKYALQALIKKLNLYEALSNVREICTKLFVLCNYVPSNMEPYHLLDHCLHQLMDAFKFNTLSYQQPKRFLPVSKKFEIGIDMNTQRSFSNGLQTYLQQHCLAESLLLLISNANSLPSFLLLSTLDLLQTLIQIPIGVNYLMDDCFDITRIIIAILLGVKHMPPIGIKEDTECKEKENKIQKKEKYGDSIKKDNKEKTEKLNEAELNRENESNIENIKSTVNVKDGDDDILNSRDMKPEDEKLIKKEVPMEGIEDIGNGGELKNSKNESDETLPVIKSEIKQENFNYYDDNNYVKDNINENEPPSLFAIMPESFQKLGREYAYKMKTCYHLEAILYYSTICTEYNSLELVKHLHAIYSQTCNTWGRYYTVEILGSNNNLQIFLDLIEREQQQQKQELQQLQIFQRQSETTTTANTTANTCSKYKSPVLSYAVDMIDCCVRYCENLEYLIEHGHRILTMAKNHENFEPSVSAVLQEMFVYLKPLEVLNVFNYGDISGLVDIIGRSLDYITLFPGDAIMALRILRYLSIPLTTSAVMSSSSESGAAILSSTSTSLSQSMEYQLYQSQSQQMMKSGDIHELKYRFVALQFYSAYGLQLLLQILEKLYTYFEQPGLHTPTLGTIQGLQCCQIIFPTLQIIREMLSFAIQCRDVEFKDLTAIDHLMRTYFVLHYFPTAGNGSARNGHVHGIESQTIIEVDLGKREIIQTFLAYTQPNEQDEELLHKSLWTQMIREILKNIDGPSTYMPGLLVLAELLPLPLPAPLPTDNADINAFTLKTQAQRLITERKLWSAHLHPQCQQIARLIENIVPTAYTPLSDLLERVCLQLADLAPNMTLLITKTLSDLLINEWFNGSQQPQANALIVRLLQFYSRLNANASVKISTLSILSGKLWDVLQAVLSMKAVTDIQIKCQISVHRLLESFLDTEISLIASSHLFATTNTQNNSNNSNNMKAAFNLASALPPKELISKIAKSIFKNVMEVEITHEISALGVRNLVILTEHDATFYHLVAVLKQHLQEFQEWMLKIIELNERTSYNSNIESLILLLRSLTQLEDTNQTYSATTLPVRTLKLNAKEFSQLMQYAKSTTTSQMCNKDNMIQRITNILKKHKEEINETLFNDMQQLQDLMIIAETQEQQRCTSTDTVNNTNITTSTTSCSSMEKDFDKMNNIGSCVEPLLLQAESIVTQYDARPIFCTYDPQTDDEQMSATYWLHTIGINELSNEQEQQQQQQYNNELITCDLIELAKTCLSLDTNLTLDCKRILHLSASPQSNRERTTTAPCFRTRRVEVEPSTGRPEKKLFISTLRGRGFGRSTPVRSDLFRSRPPNTSRPPSLHVDDFLALETCGAQPTGPTGYNKIPSLIRGVRIGRSRGSRIAAAAAYRKAKLMRTVSPSTWSDSGSPHNSHFISSGSDVTHYSTPHYVSRLRRRGNRSRPYLR